MNWYVADVNVDVPPGLANKENPAWPNVVVLTGVVNVPVADTVAGNGVVVTHPVGPGELVWIHTSGNGPGCPTVAVFVPLATKRKASTMLLPVPVMFALFRVTVTPTSVGSKLIVPTVKFSWPKRFAWLAPAERLIGPLTPANVNAGASGSLLSTVNRTVDASMPPVKLAKSNTLSPIEQLVLRSVSTVPETHPVMVSACADPVTNSVRAATRPPKPAR